MRSSGSIAAVVSVLLIQKVYTAALQPLESLTISDEVKAAVDDFVEDGEAFIQAVEDEILSTVPLEDFGDFTTLTLEDVMADPTLLNIDAIAFTTSTSDESVNDFDFELPEVKATDEATDEATAAASCANPGTRVEWRSYSDSDREAFVSAISCLTNLPSAGPSFAPSTSRFEDFVQTHQKMTPEVHGNGIFIHWHRLFLHTFEQALRTQCGFNRSMPWWDETKDSGRL